MNENYIYNQNIQNNVTKSKKLLYIIIILLLVIIITIVGILLGNTKKSYSRTIMIYMVGSNLESNGGFGTIELDGIDYEKTKNNNVDVVLIAGGTKKWHNDYIDKSETSIYHLEEGGFKKVKQQEITNMGKATTLSNFLNYTYENYSADKYELIFWNHGGGIDGSEYDDLFKENNLFQKDNLTLNEIKEGLSNTPFKGKNKLELVFFSTCLNGTIEVANYFKDFAQYIVASEEVTLSSPYTSEFKFINDIKPEDTPIEIGKKHITGYRNKINELIEESKYYDQIYSTYSIIDLSKIENLTKNVDELFKNIDVEDNYIKIAKARNNVFQYAEDEEMYDMVDLYNFVEKLKDISPDKSEKVINSFEKTVVYNWATDPRSRGLSIYFPYYGEVFIEDFLKIYDDFDFLPNYRKAINEFYEIMKNGYKNKTTYTKENIISIKEEKEEKYDFELQLSDEEIKTLAGAKYIVYKDDKNGMYKPTYIGGNAKLQDHKLTAEIRNKQLRVSAISEPDKHQPLTITQTDENDKYIWFKTNAFLEAYGIDSRDWRFQNVEFKIIFDKELQKISVLGAFAYPEENDKLTKNLAVNIHDYEAIAFSLSKSYQLFDENGNYIGTEIKSEFMDGFETEIDNFQFELETFDDDSDYYVIFYLYDIYGNTTISNLVKIQ